MPLVHLLWQIIRGARRQRVSPDAAARPLDQTRVMRTMQIGEHDTLLKDKVMTLPSEDLRDTHLMKHLSTWKSIYLISSSICAISRVQLMLRNYRLASTSPLLALSMSMKIIQPY